MTLATKKNSVPYWQKFLILFLTYFFMAKFGLAIRPVSGFATLVWPPTGIAFASLYLFGFRLWPAVGLAAFLANYWHGAPLFSALGMGVGNALEAIVAAYFFKKYAGPSTTLEKVTDVFALVIFGAIVSTFISASIGVGSLFFGGIVSYENIYSTWKAWFIGDAISDLVIAPFILVWSKLPKLILAGKRKIEGLVLGLSVVGLCSVIFGSEMTKDSFTRPYMIFPLLIWTTLRFGQHANILFITAVSTIAVCGTVAGYGPYQNNAMAGSLFMLQLFISSIAITGLFFGALGREKEKALTLRNDFISIASHELKTPITSLKLQIQVLKSGLDPKQLGPDADKILKIVNNSDQQLDRLTKLVDALLDISQIESGTLIMERKEMDLSALIADVANNFRSSMSAAHCELVLDLEPSIIGHWNQYRIEQVLTNLLMNSLKYGSGKPIKISLIRKGNMAEFAVQDHGVGIAKENQDKIFERFGRVKAAENTSGIGLGLFITKQIVGAHSGKISVSSELGHGATFTVNLPIV